MEPVGKVGDGEIDEAAIGVVALLGAVVDPHRGHAQRLGGGEIARHVLDEDTRVRLYTECRDHRRVALGLGLGAVGAGVDVVDRLEAFAETQPREHLGRIGCVAIGEDQFAAGQPRDRLGEPAILAQHVEIDIVDVREIVVRIDVMRRHQPRHRGAVLLEILFLDAPRLDRIVDPERLRDIGRHPHVHQPEQIGGRGVQRVVEIEDPASDVGEGGEHRGGR